MGPADAYEFARGNEVITDAGQPVKLSRPLDFLVVTDHSDGLGAFSKFLFNTPTDCGAAQEQVDTWHEMVVAGGNKAVQASSEIIAAFSQGKLPSCLSPSAEEFQTFWQEIIDTAEAHNDPGNFTSVIGYEWTSLLGGNNLHRNVIYRDNGDKANQLLPYTAEQSTNPEDLWNWMQAYENKTGGDVLAIPHNGNVSNGLMFAETELNGNPLTKNYAQRRQLWEPIYEVTQVKGTSETHPEISPDDEFADFEVAGWDEGNLTMSFKKPTDPEARKKMFEHEYARPALKNGLKFEASLGANPFKFGLAGATDSHIAVSAVEENSYMGKFPNEAPSAERAAEAQSSGRLGWQYGASGFMGVWATKNTRKALFDAMERREVYGTTGPRMMVRFFAGWNFNDSDLGLDLAEVGYKKGVPMGTDMTRMPRGKTPTFLVAALKDSLGANLDRIQIIKGWLDAEGNTHEKIYNVKGSDGRTPRPVTGKLTDVGNTVDTETATYTNTIGDEQLEAVWEDPDFDRSQRAFYYARVLEIPTPRWTDYDKASFGDKWCAKAKDPNACDDIPLTLQERAYTSPIWYSPAKRIALPKRPAQPVENVGH
ncbi:Protein of unknown function (DUF3604) [Rivularia sp. PCC 7116]|uniref:DUF3604 domain-containing protein n=1 Tax=Rivularia sp. PCC 7116 TaxID=373994 RepID=UPI00029F270F|nr:DUF3604 domain-containing protein [Rivularia sp. PCC 7116]AFY54181.1 Protein of unknown function (DUF3604) [Rivularia sp. PCC 7116]